MSNACSSSWSSKVTSIGRAPTRCRCARPGSAVLNADPACGPSRFESDHIEQIGEKVELGVTSDGGEVSCQAGDVAGSVIRLPNRLGRRVLRGLWLGLAGAIGRPTWIIMGGHAHASDLPLNSWSIMQLTIV